MVIGSAMSLSNSVTIAPSVALAFLFGYSLTMMPLLRGGIAIWPAMNLAFAADTLSIAVMELIDNGVMFVIPGAMEAGVTEPLFWGSLVTSLILGGIAAFPLVRCLISRGRGHAVVLKHHGSHSSPASSGNGPLFVDKDHGCLVGHSLPLATAHRTSRPARNRSGGNTRGGLPVRFLVQTADGWNVGAVSSRITTMGTSNGARD